MRILVARCEIAYHGRAVTRLGAGDRVILFKQDGSLCVHADRGFKPLNYNSTTARRPSTARKSRHRSGTPFSSCSPASSNVIPDPATRSLTVLETRT
jgi:RecB family endonuclease NucS